MLKSKGFVVTEMYEEMILISSLHADLSPSDYFSDLICCSFKKNFKTVICNTGTLGTKTIPVCTDATLLMNIWTYEQPAMLKFHLGPQYQEILKGFN